MRRSTSTGVTARFVKRQDKTAEPAGLRQSYDHLKAAPEYLSAYPQTPVGSSTIRKLKKRSSSYDRDRTMTRLPWLWPTIIFFSTTAVGVAIFGNLTFPLRPLIAFWFLIVCPGMAFVRLLRLKDGFAEWTLAIALSLAMAAIVAGILLYAGVWLPQLGLLVLIVLSLAGAALQILIAYRRTFDIIVNTIVAGLPSAQFKAAAKLLITLGSWSVAASGLALFVWLSLFLFRAVWMVSQDRAGLPDTAVPHVGSNELAEGVVIEPMETAWRTLTPTATTAPIQIMPIELLSPPDGSVCAWVCTVKFVWTYSVPLEAGQQFDIYLLSGSAEAILLGTVDRPVKGFHYQLTVEFDELGMEPGDYIWQINLNRTADGEKLATSSQGTITILPLR